MTHPQHPCPPRNPHCGGTTQPPNPGNTNTPKASIDNHGFVMLILTILIIVLLSFTNPNRKKK